MQVLFRGINVESTCKIIRGLTYALFKGYRRIRLDFRGSLMSGLRSSPKRDDSREFGGRSAGSFSEQWLVIEPNVTYHVHNIPFYDNCRNSRALIG